MGANPTRREFIKRGAAAVGTMAVPTLIPASALGADGGTPPSERIVVGLTNGKKTEALAIYRTLANAQQPSHIRSAAERGAAIADKKQ